MMKQCEGFMEPEVRVKGNHAQNYGGCDERHDKASSTYLGWNCHHNIHKLYLCVYVGVYCFYFVRLYVRPYILFWFPCERYVISTAYWHFLLSDAPPSALGLVVSITKLPVHIRFGSEYVFFSDPVYFILERSWTSSSWSYNVLEKRILPIF